MTNYFAIGIIWTIFVLPILWIIFCFGKALDEWGTLWRWVTVMSLLALPLYFGLVLQIFKDLSS